MSQSQVFSEVYSLWLEPRLPGRVIETLATCNNCAMQKPKGLTRDPGPFRGDLKCCTYFPYVPNFGLGAMIAKNSLGLDRYRAAGEQGILLPVGLFVTPERQADIQENPDDFGNREDWLCPFYDRVSQGCSVWAQRPGVCTTYFCKSNRGAEGLQFWADTEAYLNHFEWTLAKEVFTRLGGKESQMEICETIMTLEEGEEREHWIREVWRPWQGKDQEFFVSAWDEAQKVSSGRLNQILDPEFLELEGFLRQQLK